MEKINLLYNVISHIEWNDIVDFGYKFSVVIIALSNLFFARKIFFHNDKKDNLKTENDRKIKWLTTLILDYSLENFYSFFDKLELELEKCKIPLTPEEKSVVNSSIGDQFVFFRRKFIDLLIAVDKQLYDQVLQHSDSLQDEITNIIFDEGINLTHAPKFEECFSEKLTSAKSGIIKEIFDYKG